MARNRSITSRKRKSKKELVDVDITSLLDILVILLVFLLRSYNSSGITMNVPPGIELPKSDSQTFNSPGIMIQVAKDQIWVDNQSVLSTEETEKKNIYDHGGKRIIPLFNELAKKKQQIKEIALRAKEAKEFSGIANLIVDKSIKYNYLKKIMYTCAEAGFKEYKFIVLGDE